MAGKGVAFRCSPRCCHIEENPPFRAEVHARLRRDWSPEEVAGSLWRDHPELPAMHTRHESIYRYVYVVARGELKRELVACLRRHHSARRPRRRGVASAQGQLEDRVLGDERPPEVETRIIPGHYEGDLIAGAGNRSAVGVLVEPTTRYTFLCHLPQKDTTSVREAFERKLAPLPGILRQSLTYDQGKEMAEHQSLAANLQLKVFFCHAYSPWGRATCESQNDRIRHSLPKGTDLSLSRINSSAPTKRCSTSAPAKITRAKRRRGGVVHGLEVNRKRTKTLTAVVEALASGVLSNPVAGPRAESRRDAEAIPTAVNISRPRLNKFETKPYAFPRWSFCLLGLQECLSRV